MTCPCSSYSCHVTLFDCRSNRPVANSKAVTALAGIVLERLSNTLSAFLVVQRAKRTGTFKPATALTAPARNVHLITLYLPWTRASTAAKTNENATISKNQKIALAPLGGSSLTKALAQDS